MADLVLHQLVNPGAPFLYAAGISRMDMRTFVDLYFSPEGGLGSLMQLNLAKSLGLPTFDYAGYSDAKCHDEQWGADMIWSTFAGAFSRGTLLHDVGYLESGMASSFECLVLGDNLAGCARAFMQDVPIDETTVLIDELAEVGPGGSYLGRPLTRRRSREFWRSDFFDGSNFSQWEASGRHTLGDRVRARTLEMVATAPEPVVDAQAVSDLAALVEQARKRTAAET